VKNEVLLCPFNSSSRGTFHIRIAAKRPVNLDQKDQCLVVVRFDFRNPLEKRGGSGATAAERIDALTARMQRIEGIARSSQPAPATAAPAPMPAAPAPVPAP